jgi:hypothetical protein
MMRAAVEPMASEPQVHPNDATFARLFQMLCDLHVYVLTEVKVLSERLEKVEPRR